MALCDEQVTKWDHRESHHINKSNYHNAGLTINNENITF